MKILRAELEEIIGILIGLVFWYFFAFVIMTMSISFNISHQITTWVFLGLIVLSMTIGHYLVSRSVIDVKNRNDDIITIKSNLIGYFLWLSLIILAYLFNIEINDDLNLAGGYIIILLIYLYMRKRADKEEKYTNFTPTKAALIVILLMILVNVLKTQVFIFK